MLVSRPPDKAASPAVALTSGLIQSLSIAHSFPILAMCEQAAEFQNKEGRIPLSPVAIGETRVIDKTVAQKVRCNMIEGDREITGYETMSTKTAVRMLWKQRTLAVLNR